MSDITNTPVLYLAWWTYHDPYDGADGLLGIFNTEELAIAAAKKHVTREDVECNDGASVTKVKMNEEGQYISCYAEDCIDFYPEGSGWKPLMNT